jgi:hypothetical protein
MVTPQGRRQPISTSPTTSLGVGHDRASLRRHDDALIKKTYGRKPIVEMTVETKAGTVGRDEGLKQLAKERELIATNRTKLSEYVIRRERPPHSYLATWSAWYQDLRLPRNRPQYGARTTLLTTAPALRHEGRRTINSTSVPGAT